MLSSLGLALLRFLVHSFHMRTSLSCGLIFFKSGQICEKIFKRNCLVFILFDTRQTTSPITGPTIQRHSQFVFPCSCSSSGTLLPLQESCHVNLLSFSATWSSEVIRADCKFFELTLCGVFLTFEENISREEIPSLPGCC